VKITVCNPPKYVTTNYIELVKSIIYLFNFKSRVTNNEKRVV